MKPRTNHFNPQVGKLKREFRLTCIHKGCESKWHNRTEIFDWYFIFKYLDDGSLFAVYEDFNNKIVRKLNHQEVLELLNTERK